MKRTLLLIFIAFDFLGQERTLPSAESLATYHQQYARVLELKQMVEQAQLVLKTAGESMQSALVAAQASEAALCPAPLKLVWPEVNKPMCEKPAPDQGTRIVPSANGTYAWPKALKQLTRNGLVMALGQDFTFANGVITPKEQWSKDDLVLVWSN